MVRHLLSTRTKEDARDMESSGSIQTPIPESGLLDPLRTHESLGAGKGPYHPTMTTLPA